MATEKNTPAAEPVFELDPVFEALQDAEGEIGLVERVLTVCANALRQQESIGEIPQCDVAFVLDSTARDRLKDARESINKAIALFREGRP